MLAGQSRRCETPLMILPDNLGPVEDEKETPPRVKQDGDKDECGCGDDHSPEEQGVESAYDFMRKFLKKSEQD